MHSLADHGIGGGFKKGSKVAVGKVRLDSVIETVWTKATTYNTNDVRFSAYNPTTDELFCLVTSNRTISVYDATSGTLKRTITLAALSDTTLNIAALWGILILSGRLYVCGTDTMGYNSCSITELNPSTGAVIKNKYTQSGSSNTIWLVQVVGSELWMGDTTGRIWKFDANLTTATSLNYTNSVGCGAVGRTGLHVANGLICYSQTANAQTPLRRLSDGGTLAYLTGSNNDRTCITKNYVVVASTGTAYIHNLSGTQLFTVSLPAGLGGTWMNMIEVFDDVVCLAWTYTTAGYAFIDCKTGKVIYNLSAGTATDSGVYSSGIFHKIDNFRFTLPFGNGFGVYKPYHKLI